ncbi:GNAT family N-acetyltransferase [Methylomonas rhizoryzae]|uniref:GNAT family N-acetyltransferase n=1 Tax=Methylomonas rhizoryzae TaxID=2608981 RepID=UPI0012323CB8|nr:GNAT family N-acetyltransferase [Methylomonas rhizoryzae]
MSLHVTIRSALPADAENISALIQGEAHYCTIHPNGEGAQPFFSSVTPEAIAGYVTSPNFIYLLGYVDSELAGVVAVRDGSHLYHLFVAAKFQRRGIASSLWARAKAKAVESGNAQGFTVNAAPHALPVYERFGFEIQGIRVEENGVAFVPMKLPG